MTMSEWTRPRRATFCIDMVFSPRSAPEIVVVSQPIGEPYLMIRLFRAGDLHSNIEICDRNPTEWTEYDLLL